MGITAKEIVTYKYMTSDGVVFGSREEAVKHELRTQIEKICIRMDYTMDETQAAVEFLTDHRDEILKLLKEISE